MKRKDEAKFVGSTIAARILGCSVNHFHLVVAPMGVIRSFRLVGSRQRRYFREDCERVAREHGVPAEAADAEAA